MSPRVPRTRYSDSSRMPSEQCAEESVGRDVHCITISPGNAGRTCTVPHESRVTTTRGRAWLVGRYWQSDLAKLLESKTTSQQQLMSVQVQQSRFPTPMVVIGFPPPGPCPQPRVFPPPQNASWRGSPHPSWDFGDQSLCRRLLLVLQNAQHGTEKSKQRIMLAQTHRKIASAATRPKGAWTSIRILLRAWGAPSDPWRCTPASPGAAISRDEDRNSCYR